jgi:phage terminase Nu1 subunit (DNA packaging protein)
MNLTEDIYTNIINMIHISHFDTKQMKQWFQNERKGITNGTAEDSIRE